jgi:CheY-like chemotaxis protein/HPt (histidine-containing phosphotransfer) domain-containing protein
MNQTDPASNPSIPKLLLVEDDPTTRAFLIAAAEALPADVDAVATVAEALVRAGANDYALWLIDANLPDGDGAGLLATLRSRGLRTPALAHTATRERAAAEALVAAGFLAVLVKPMPAATLQAAIRDALDAHAPAPLHLLESPPSGDAPIWNDEAALTALNNEQTHVDALRGLFLDELPTVRTTVAAAARDGNDAALRSALHRLQASCGFVGAARISAAVAAMQEQPGEEEALDGFLAAVDETLRSVGRGDR